MGPLIVCVTAGEAPEPKCLAGITSQTAPADWVVVGRRSRIQADGLISKCENAAANRRAAKAMALTTDATHVLFVDSDVVIPPHAVEEFAKQPKDIQGGWYPIKGTPDWAAGVWVADHTFHRFTEVQPSLVKTDMIGSGCLWVSRKALEAIPLDAGTDKRFKLTTGREGILGNCGVFGNNAAERGFKLYMNGSVICEHLERTK